MPPAPKHNWNYLYDVYEKLCETAPDTSYAEFARQNGVDVGACRAAFNRIKKKRAKRTLRTKTGRTNERKEPSIFDEVSPEEASAIVKQVSSERVVAVHAKALEILCCSLNRIETVQKKQFEKDADGNDKIKIETVRDIKDCFQAESALVGLMREILPFISELKDRTGVEGIISKLQGREYDVTQAALEISKMGVNLPEALRIMLSKTPPVVIANTFEALDTDELDQRALEVMQQVKWQYECFLPERREEVIQMKKELSGAESFVPEKGKDDDNDDTTD